MELLYLLLGIIGLLCFYYCVKYIFRDTNRLYHYKGDMENMEHLTGKQRIGLQDY